MRGLGNTLTGTARQRGMQDAEKTPDQPGSSQPRAGVPGLEVSLRQLSQRCFLQLCLAQQLFEARVLLAQLTQFLGLTTTHRPITLAPPAQRRLADTQHAAGLGRTHALTSQRLGLLQLHDNLLRRVLRELPHGHPFCPATSSQDYSEQPSQNKRSEKPRPLHTDIESLIARVRELQTAISTAAAELREAAADIAASYAANDEETEEIRVIIGDPVDKLIAVAQAEEAAK